MSAKKELRGYSKAELINIILEERQLRQELEERLKEIEAMLSQYNNANTPSSQQRFKENTKSKEEKQNSKDRFPGREKGHKGAGIKLPKPDKTTHHKINRKGYVKVGSWSKTVIDFAENPIIVTKHIIYQYKTPSGRIVEKKVDLPKGVYGKHLQAFNVLLKGKLGSSHESIADLIRALRPDITFCAATSQKNTDFMAQTLQEERNNILHQVREALYCNADETGLRQDGLNGYAWVFCTPTLCLYETDLSRSGKVPERVLGKDNDIILTVDGWQGYNKYNRQRCWPHLMRELDKLAEDYKHVTNIQLQAAYLHKLYKQALQAKKKPPNKRKKWVEKVDSKTELGLMINSLSKTKHCKSFVTTLTNARPYLFTGVINPEIPLDNNHAERMLRKIVVHRKLMGCIRNEKGQLFIHNVMSCIQTWKLQQKNIYQELKKFAS